MRRNLTSDRVSIGVGVASVSAEELAIVSIRRSAITTSRPSRSGEELGYI